MKEKYFVLTIDGDVEECNSLEKAKELVKECVYDSTEGYHPDAETVIILKQVFETEILDTPKGYKLNFKSLNP